MKRNLFVCLVVLLLTACATDQSYDLVIQDVGMFDGEKDLGIVNIAISADTIAAISKRKLLSDSVIIATGKYIIPGLVNSHVHMWELEQLKESYRAGVLANMGMHASSYSRDSSLRAHGKMAGFPFYYSAHTAATVPGGHPTWITPNIETINDSISVEQFVTHRMNDEADYIKIIKESSPWFGQPKGPPSLPYDSIKKIIDVAHSNGLKAVVHIGSLEEMTTISKFKPDGFVHMWYSSINAELTEEKLKLIKESGVFIVPTAMINKRARELAYKEGPDFALYAKENYLTFEEIKESIKQVHNAGIFILAGTDNGNFDLNWGDDLIDELIIYSQSGMNNIEVLKTATGNPAKAWGIPVGFLQVGRQANMILLNANPLENLENLRDINTVWKNGLLE
ncbi:MAG: amidohydrolase family protein [Maribacter sp.]|nr:amidohydrolase family protein [Maribacter sp.]